MIKARVDIDHKGTGIVVGIIDARGSRVISHGTLREGGPSAAADTVFEIGSITKVFTATVLADMARRREVKLTDPIGKYLPASVKTPAFQDKAITLGDLASQLSGLPGTPSNLAPKNPANPYADYTVEQMYANLSAYQPTRASGERYEYSNFGVGLLGHILALRAGVDYEALVRARITKPLGMNSTGIELSEDMKKRLALGYGMPGMPAGSWDMPSLPGAGALRSTTTDMLKFVGANMGFVRSPLRAAMRETHVPRHPLEGMAGYQIGLGWHILEQHGSHIVWHNGGTAGYRTFIGFDPNTRRGVVLLSNSHSGSDDIARRVLNRAFPLFVYAPPAVLVDALAARGYGQALTIYRELSAKDPKFGLSEQFVNQWGYELMGRGKLKESLEILKMNAILYPESWNVYDSLGEAYEKNGMAADAITNFRQSLQLNPGNKNAEQQLKMLAPSIAP